MQTVDSKYDSSFSIQILVAAMKSNFPQPTTWWEVPVPVAIYIGLPLLPVLVAGGWLLRRKRPAQIWDPAIWVAAALVPIILLSWHSRLRLGSELLEIDPIIPVFLLCLLTFIGISCSLIRLSLRKLVGEGSITAVAALAMSYLLMQALFPPLSYATPAAFRMACRNNLKQIGLALHMHHDIGLTSPWQKIGQPPQSWRVAILPYLDQARLFNNYRHDLKWDSPENTVFSKQEVEVFLCPSQKHRQDDQGRWLTSYAVLLGPNQIWREDGPPTQKEIPDGTSNTIMVVEACGQNIVWNEPRDIDVTTTPMAFNLPGEKPYQSPAMFSSLHKAGAHVLMADGTVRLLSSKIDPQTLQALTTADGGETVGEY